jgi:biotin operon repressor
MNSVSNDYGIKRLASKNARNAIIQKLSSDFNLTPIIAEAFYQQFTIYFNEHSNIELSDGEVAYEAVAAEEPAGKHIRLTRKITTKLNLINLNTDLEALAEYGLAGLRRHRLMRMTRQAYDQEALLSYEDLAMLLTTSPSTIKRDIANLKQQGLFIMTRGTKHDMGPGLSHKTIILDLYFNGYTFTDIELKTNHSETSIKRYLTDFTQVAMLYKQKFSPQQIRLIAKKSNRLVREYIQLYQTFEKQDNQRLHDLLTPQKPGTDAKKKSANESLSGGAKDEQSTN